MIGWINTRVRGNRVPVLVAFALALALAACSSSSKSSSQPSATTASPGTSASSTTSQSSAPPVVKLNVTGKQTTLTFGAQAVQALTAAGVQTTPVAPATAAASGVINLPISGGTLTKTGLQGTISHSGGLAFTHAGKTITATSLVLNTTSGLLSGTVQGKQVALLAVDLSRMVRTTSGSQIVASGITWTVIPTAAASLNGQLTVAAFQRGSVVGTLTTYVTGTTKA